LRRTFATEKIILRFPVMDTEAGIYFGKVNPSFSAAKRSQEKQKPRLGEEKIKRGGRKKRVVHTKAPTRNHAQKII